MASVTFNLSENFPSISFQNMSFAIENQTNVVAVSYPNASGGSPGSGRFYVLSLPFVFNSNLSVRIRGDYNLTANITDNSGNWAKFLVKPIKFIQNPDASEHDDINLGNINATNFTSIDSSNNTNVSIDILFGSPTNGTVDIVKYSSAPDGVNFTGAALGKYVEVVGDPNILSEMQYAIFRLHYTDSDITQNGITDESSIRFYYFNETTQTWEAVSQSGDDPNNNFVWMNTTHFSTYGVFEASQQSPGGGSSSGSGTSSSWGSGGGYSIPVGQNVSSTQQQRTVTYYIECDKVRLPPGSSCSQTEITVPNVTVEKQVPVYVTRVESPWYEGALFAAVGLLSAALALSLARRKGRG